MANFDLAIKIVLANEGGLSENASDPGGITNFGISYRWLKSRNPAATPDDVRNLTKDVASALYHKYWWNDHNYDLILDQNVCNKIFDMAVNMGSLQAHKLVQRAAVACGKTLTVDGILGPASIKVLNDCDPQHLLEVLKGQAVSFYINLVAARPRLSVFLRGWLRRANA